jgi:hypothetical protein
LQLFEGGIRPAAFIHSPLLPTTAQGQWYDGIVSETDWFSTFLSLGLAKPPSNYSIDGMNIWPTLLSLGKGESAVVPFRDELLIADFILRQGKYKLITGGDHKNDWSKSLLRDCMLGTGGGWLTPPNTTDNICPMDIYTKSAQKTALCCDNDNGTLPCKVVADEVDQYLCSDPCTPDHPCLYDLEQVND